MSKSTSGEWSVRSGKDWRVRYDKDGIFIVGSHRGLPETVAEVMCVGAVKHRAEANARLIADAPAKLAELEALTDRHNDALEALAKCLRCMETGLRCIETGTDYNAREWGEAISQVDSLLKAERTRERKN